jgi:hypothetical protein
MSFDLDFVESFQWAFFIALLVGSIFILRKTHAWEIYMVWYVYSFFFVLLSCMQAVAEYNNSSLTEVCGSYEETCKWLYDLVTNDNDEFILVATVLVLVIVPQLVTYVFSAASGSAYKPRFVQIVGQIAFWSVVKFIAGLGGIVSAEPMGKRLVGQPIGLSEFFGGVIYISVAFAFAAAYVLLAEKLPAWFGKRFEHVDEEKSPIRFQIKYWLNRAHKFATRHVHD